MKKHYISLLGTATLLLFLFTQKIMAQTVSTAYENEINTIFNGVDKTKVPHKLLLDYGMEFTDLLGYDGTLSNENFIHKGTYESIYNTLLMSRVQSNVTGLVSPTTFNSNWNNLRTANKIVLSGLYYKYSVFKDNASPNYITISNNKLYDKYVNGVWQNPYEDKQVFAISSPILLYNYLTVDVELPTALWYTNQGANVQSIAIDFDNGQGYQTMTLDQVKSVNYSQEGVYEWTYKLTLTNNQVLYSHSKIKIEGNQLPPPTSALRTINEPCVLDDNNIDTVEFFGTQTYLGIANSATLEIRYRDDNCTDGITKPLIVAEGFESGLLGVENPLGENTYQDFIGEALDNTGDLPGELNDYDVIYVNWDQGRDFLQRNALLLEDIITWVNDTKTTNTENVVLGQSMGGVIARYALADMEQSPNLDHDTSLYISHDAPHQGANIPISIQYFARHMIDQFISTPLGDIDIPLGTGGPISIEDIENIFNAPGTKQLLDNTIGSSFALDNTLHDAWQTELENLGYPQQTRNIAISNGNHCANPQVINPEDVLFSFNGEANPSTLTSLLIEFIPLLNTVNDLAFVALAIIFDEPALLLGILPGKSKLSFDFNCKALPSAGSTEEVYDGNITFTKTLLFVININLNITDRSYNNPAGVNLSYDYYPGGFFPIPFDFDGVDISNAFFNANITASAADSFNFIPTPSALDIGEGNAVLNNNDYFTRYNANTPPASPKNTPFDNFTTAYDPNLTINEQHISFNTLNGDWLALELNDINNDEEAFDCTFICKAPRILGSSYACLNTSQTYSVNGLPTNVMIDWEISPAGGFTITPNGSSVTISPTGNFQGVATLTLTVSNDDCGTVTATKSIQTGAERPIIYDENGNQVASFTFCMLDYDGVTFDTPTSSQWEWRNISNTFAMTTSNNSAQFFSSTPASGYVDVRAMDPNCGWSARTILYINLIDCSGGGGNFRMAQNPVNSGTLTVVETNDNGSVQSRQATNNRNAASTQSSAINQEDVTLELYDFTGLLLDAKTEPRNTNQGRYSLNISEYANGSYFIKIISGDIIEIYQVIIDN